MAKMESPLRVSAVVALAVLLNALVLLGFSQLLDSFTLNGPGAALGSALILGLVNGGLIYGASRLSLRLGVFAIGAFLFGINVAAIVIAGLLIRESEEAVIAVAYTGGGMALVTGLLIWFFSIGEEVEPDEAPQSDRTGPTDPEQGGELPPRPIQG
jgi:uncharacterized membrane protein YvlD (DUF360 family)